MAITAKIDYLFNEFKQGWSETWYVLDVSDLSAAFKAGLANIPSRVALLGANASLEAMRVSNVDVWGDSFVTSFGPQQFKAAQASGEVADIPGAAILFRIEATSAYRRMFLMRGVPDGWITAPTSINPSGIDAYASVLKLGKAWLANLKASPAFYLKVLSKETGFERKYVNGLTVAAGKLVISTIQPHGMTSGNKFRLSRSIMTAGSILSPTGLKSVNGVWFVDNVIDGNNFNVAGLALSADWAGKFTDGTTVHRISPIYAAVTDLVPQRVGTRRTGRAFFVPRGRRRARR